MQILIADDEQEEREGIAFLIEEYHFPLTVSMVENGKQALAYMKDHPIDILFTDVRMPFIDGLTLSKEALLLNPNLKIILFSGFSEFEYARTAITLGVSHYILKPVNLTEFQEVMQKVIQEVSTLSEKRETHAKQEYYANKHILYRAVHGMLEVHSSSGTISLDFLNRYRRMFLLESPANLFEKEDSSLESFFAEIVPASTMYINLNPYESILLFWENDAYPLTYERIADQIHRSVSSKYGSDCFIAVSMEISSMQEMAPCLLQLEELMEYRFFLPDTYLFLAGEENLKKLTNSLNDDEVLNEVLNDLKSKDLQSAKSNIHLLNQKFLNQTNFSHLYVKFLYSNLYKNIMSENPLANDSDRIRSGIENIYTCNLFQNIVRIIDDALLQYETFLSKDNSAGNRDVEAVKHYIQKHYKEPLDLESLSAKVYLSPGYLSHIFKKETGYGLNKYIKAVRMEKAKQLLHDTHFKIIDICEQVGYSNVSYFCQNFREFYGVTPEKYRSKGESPC